MKEDTRVEIRLSPTEEKVCNSSQKPLARRKNTREKQAKVIILKKKKKVSSAHKHKRINSNYQSLYMQPALTNKLHVEV